MSPLQALRPQEVVTFSCLNLCEQRALAVVQANPHNLPQQDRLTKLGARRIKVHTQRHFFVVCAVALNRAGHGFIGHWQLAEVGAVQEAVAVGIHVVEVPIRSAVPQVLERKV